MDDLTQHTESTLSTQSTLSTDAPSPLRLCQRGYTRSVTTQQYTEAERLICESIADVKERRIKVRPGDVGCFHGDYSSTWIEDAFAEGLSPIGCFLLEKTTDAEGPYTAVKELLGISAVWAMGVDDGFEDRRCAQQEAGQARELYRAGFQFGQQLRETVR